MEISEALRRELALLCGGGFEDDSDGAASNIIQADVPLVPQGKHGSHELASIIFGMQNGPYSDQARDVPDTSMKSETDNSKSCSIAVLPEFGGAETKEQCVKVSSVTASPTNTAPSKKLLCNAEIVEQILSLPDHPLGLNLTQEEIKIEEQNLIDIKRNRIEVETCGEYSLGDTLDEVYCFGRNLSGYNECRILENSTESNFDSLTIHKGKGGKTKPAVMDLNVVIKSEPSTCLQEADEKETGHIYCSAPVEFDVKNISCLVSSGTSDDQLNVKPNTKKLTSAELFFQSIQRVIDEGNKDFVQGPVHPCQLIHQQVESKVDQDQHGSEKSCQNDSTTVFKYPLSSIVSDELPLLPEIKCRAVSSVSATKNKMDVSEEKECNLQLLDSCQDMAVLKSKVDEITEVVSSFEDLVIQTESLLSEAVDSITCCVTRAIATEESDVSDKNRTDCTTFGDSECAVESIFENEDKHGDGDTAVAAASGESNPSPPIVLTPKSVSCGTSVSTAPCNLPGESDADLIILTTEECTGTQEIETPLPVSCTTIATSSTA